MPVFDNNSVERIAAVVRAVESGSVIPRSLRRRKKRGGAPPSSSSFMALVGANASIGTNRYKYAWTEAELNGNAFQTLSGGRSGTTTTDFALNMVEAPNTTNLVGPGWDMTGGAIQGFALQPIVSGTAVTMWPVTDAGGSARYVFQCTPAIDGDCPTQTATALIGKDGNQASTGTGTTVPTWTELNTLDADLYTMNTSTGVLTINAAGDYLVRFVGTCRRTASGVSKGWMALYHNGSAVDNSECWFSVDGDNISDTVIVSESVVSCVATDTLEYKFKDDGGGAINVIGDSTQMMVILI